MASFKAKFPVLQELFAKNNRGGALWAPPPSGARVKVHKLVIEAFSICTEPSSGTGIDVFNWFMERALVDQTQPVPLKRGKLSSTSEPSPPHHPHALHL